MPVGVPVERGGLWTIGYKELRRADFGIGSRLRLVQPVDFDFLLLALGSYERFHERKVFVFAAHTADEL